MITIIVNIVVFIVILGVGFAANMFISKKGTPGYLDKKRAQADELKVSAQKEVERIKKEIAEFVSKKKEMTEREIKTKELRIEKLREVVESKNTIQAKKEEKIKEQRLKLAAFEEELQGAQFLVKRTKEETTKKLTEKVGKNMGELKEEVLERYKNDLEKENAEKISKTEDLLKEDAEKTAKKIIIGTLQRLSSPTSVETRAITIKVPRDNIKGRIVGKAGENIRAFEEELDVDVVFNDLPNTISISGFMLVERRVAQKAMESLVKTRADIRPETVKRIIREAREETEKELHEIGKNSMAKMGLVTKNNELCKTIGRLQYRTSYGQNIMKHSMEVGWVAQMLSAEIKANPRTCLLAGFLHDLGKAIDQDPNITDTHDKLTKELMEKHGFKEEEIHAAWTHHDSEEQKTPEALLVKAADAISASRPGARQESFDKYIERINALEETASSYEGVKSAFAISAGRELRVIVDTEKIRDEDMGEMAEKIRDQIEEEIVYPGQIKVNIIRRTKHTETVN